MQALIANLPTLELRTIPRNEDELMAQVRIVVDEHSKVVG